MSDTTTITNDSHILISVIVGFFAMGLLVGSIAGLSDSELTLALLGFLFSFAGGSVIAFMGKIPKPSIGLAGVALSSFCLAATAALYVSLFIKVNEILFVDENSTLTVENHSQVVGNQNIAAARQDYRSLLRNMDSQRLEDFLHNEVALGDMKLSIACTLLTDGSIDARNPANDQ